MTTHPAIKAAIEALEIAQEELHGLNRTFTAREVVGKRLTALRALEGCVVIERGEVPDGLKSAVENFYENAKDLEICRKVAALVAAQMKGE